MVKWAYQGEGSYGGHILHLKKWHVETLIWTDLRGSTTCNTVLTGLTVQVCQDTGISRGMSPCPQLCRSLNEWMHAVNSTSLDPHPQLSASPHLPQSLPLPFQNISLGFVCLTGIGGSCQYVLVVTFYEHVCLLTESSKSQNQGRNHGIDIGGVQMWALPQIFF